MMKGKTNEIKTSPTFQECTIKFSPSSGAKKRSTVIVFESFHIYDCGTYLLVQQSPSEFFDRELSTLVSMHQDNTSMCFIPQYTPLLYSKTGVYRSIHYFLIFALKHILWVLVRTASLRRF